MNAPASSQCPYSDLSGRFDPFDGEPTRMYPIYAEARRSEPVFYSPRIGYWVVTRYDDVKTVMGGEPAVFSAGNALELVRPLCPAALQVAIDNRLALSPSVVDEDPPVHTLHRKSLHKPLARGRMQALEPLVRQLAVSRLAELAPRRAMDLVADFLFELPAYILFELLGVPREELARVRRFCQRLAVLGFGEPGDAEQVAMLEGLAEFRAFCSAHIARLLVNPGNDAMSEFIAGLRDPASETPLDLDYVTTVCFQLFFAGHETTVNAAAGGMRALLEHPAQWRALCENPDLLDNAVEECLRYAPSVPA